MRDFRNLRLNRTRRRVRAIQADFTVAAAAARSRGGAPSHKMRHLQEMERG
jgi:hypothetical protein